MSTVSSISIFFITAFQQQPFRYSFFRSFTVLHRRAPKSSLHHGVFLCLTRAFFCTWFPKSKTAASQSVCKSHFHAKLQGCAATRCGERTSPDCQIYFAAHDDQLSCSICGLPATCCVSVVKTDFVEVIFINAANAKARSAVTASTSTTLKAIGLTLIQPVRWSLPCIADQRTASQLSEGLLAALNADFQLQAA